MRRALSEAQGALDQERGQIWFMGLRGQIGPNPAGDDRGVDVEPLIEAMAHPQAPRGDVPGGPGLVKGSSEPEAKALGLGRTPRPRGWVDDGEASRGGIGAPQR